MSRGQLRTALVIIAISSYLIGLCSGKGAGRNIGHKLRVGGEVGRYTKYSQVRTPYTEDWKDNRTAQWYAGKKGAKITKASHFDFEYVLGHKIVLLCVAKGKPRPNIIWFKDGRELYAHRYLHISQYWRGKHRIKSKMEIDPATQGDSGIYECHANNMYSIDMRSFRTDYNIFISSSALSSGY
eukprot:TRINITY_DN11260_c0_g1_i1.p1 TRINITY_DN11260_c0_g1~~TRINITY_DN11260_c0_g1_i1.p1  ORF type:complete len:208 (+),score=42.37 TRINITY_DN11260_c0_g1_i1:77-625(+)